jgi:hypothetical protein
MRGRRGRVPCPSRLPRSSVSSPSLVRVVSLARPSRFPRASESSPSRVRVISLARPSPLPRASESSPSRVRVVSLARPSRLPRASRSSRSLRGADTGGVVRERDMPPTRMTRMAAGSPPIPARSALPALSRPPPPPPPPHPPPPPRLRAFRVVVPPPPHSAGSRASREHGRGSERGC